MSITVLQIIRLDFLIFKNNYCLVNNFHREMNCNKKASFIYKAIAIKIEVFRPNTVTLSDVFSSHYAHFMF